MSSSWNVELARAADARVNYYMSLGSSKEFMWRKAHAAILAVQKEIRRMPSGLIVNMPRLRETTTQQELEAVIRGEKEVIPPEMAGIEAIPRDIDDHPYLKRMQYRGGGYAILMALSKKGGFMYKPELVREAQQFCDVSMESIGDWERSSSCGWASSRSLLQHRLLLASRIPGRGPRRDEYSLTEDGKQFLQAMRRKWPEQSSALDHGHQVRSRSPRRCSPQQLQAAAASAAASSSSQPSLPSRPAVGATPQRRRPSPATPVAVGSRRRQLQLQLSFTSDGASPRLGTRQLRLQLSRASEPDFSPPQPQSETMAASGCCPKPCSSSCPEPASASCLQPAVADTADTTTPRRPRWRSLALASGEGETPGKAGPRADIVQSPTPLAAIFRRQMSVAPSSVADPSIEVSSDDEAKEEGDMNRVAGTSEEGNPADAVEQGFPQASGSEELPSGSDSQTSAMMAVDGCSGHASPDDGTATCGQGSSAEDPKTVFLLVDQRERLRDVDPRGILNRASAAVQGPYQSVMQHRLLLGDFLWTTGLRACERSGWQVLDCVVERKRVSDLVGRSATGAHLRQMKRMELSGLGHPFLLIEGDQRQANSCPIFDEFESSAASSERGYTGSCAIHSLEDVEALCARLFITGSPIGVMATKDIEGTVRLLKQITSWFQWRLSSAEEEHRSLISGQSLQHVEVSARSHLHEASNATCPCSVHEEQLTDGSTSKVQMVASPSIYKRVTRDSPEGLLPSWLTLKQSLGFPPAGLERSSWCEIVAGEQAAGRVLGKMLVVVVSGGHLLGQVKDAAARLPHGAPQAAVADSAAAALAAKLRPAGDHSRRLLIVEGLCAAARAAAADAAGLPADILGVAELSALLLDIRCGWRVRVHETKSPEATVRFLRAIAREVSAFDCGRAQEA